MSSPRPLSDISPSVQTAILDCFVQTLDPEAPVFCAHFYRTCTVIIEPWEALQTLRVTRPDFFTAALRFLTHSRTGEDLQRLDSRMSVCRCNLEGQLSLLMHAVDHGDTPSDLRELFDSIGYALARCFCDAPLSTVEHFEPLSLDKSRKRAKKAQKDGRSLLWPQQPTDLFVYPPEQMWTMLWQIFHTYEGSSLLFFLQTITVAAGTTFTSLVHKIPSFPQQYIYHFKRLMAIEDQFEKLGDFAIFLGRIFQQTSYDDSVRFSIWIPYVQEMLSLLTQTIRASTKLPQDATEPDPLISCLSFIGSHLISTFGTFTDVNLSQCAPEILRQVLVDTEMYERQGFATRATAWAHVHRLLHSDQCFTLGCPETFSTQNRKFAACGGCGIVSYCSKACQAADWKDVDVSHKPLCKAFREYRRKFGVDWKKVLSAQNLTSARLNEAGVTEEESSVISNLLDRRCDLSVLRSTK